MFDNSVSKYTAHLSVAPRGEKKTFKRGSEMPSPVIDPVLAILSVWSQYPAPNTSNLHNVRTKKKSTLVVWCDACYLDLQVLNTRSYSVHV